MSDHDEVPAKSMQNGREYGEAPPLVPMGT
jgi:hypothetical protein